MAFLYLYKIRDFTMFFSGVLSVAEVDVIRAICLFFSVAIEAYLGVVCVVTQSYIHLHQTKRAEEITLGS